MSTVRQISVFLENKPGSLTDFTKLLQKENIDLRALSIAEQEDFGIVRVIVDDAYATMQALKDAGYICSMTKVLAVELEDKPGALAAVLSLLDEHGINLEYTYAFLTGKSGSAFLILRVADNEAAIRVLGEGGITTVCQDDLAEVFQ